MDCGHLQFTLDGRLVGDIGELIAARYFDVRLHPRQQGRHDAVCRVGEQDLGVQIKCRVMSDAIDFTSEPDLLLVMRINREWTSWDLLYNGPGSIVTQGTALTLDNEGHLLRDNKRTKRRMNLADFAGAGTQLPAGSLQVPERRTAAP